MTDLLALDDVHAYYGSFHALRGNTLTVGEGEIVSLLGGNASGKSTTMRTILGLTTVRSGTVRFAGEDLTHVATSRRIKAGIASVPEARRVFPQMTVDENLTPADFMESYVSVDRIEHVVPALLRAGAVDDDHDEIRVARRS